MRRLLVLVCALSGVLATASVALADDGDVAKPACADVRNADFFYTTSSTVNVNIETQEPSCKGITYTLHVVVDPGEEVTTSVRGNGTTIVQIAGDTFSDADNVVCAYVTSSRGGKEGMNQPFDRTPNETCVTLVPGGSGGTGFH